MDVGEIQPAAGAQEMGDDPRPAGKVGQPADGAPGGEHQVERRRLGQRLARGIEVRGHEPCRQAQRCRILPRRLDRRGREVEPGHHGALAGQHQAVIAEVALQVQHAQPGHRPQLGPDDAQPGGAVAERRQVVAGRGAMQRHALVPIGAVQLLPVGGVRARH